AGLLLLDPSNITISNAANTAGISFNVLTRTYADTGGLGTQNIEIAHIIGNLNDGNVTVTTASTAGQLGNLTVTDSFDWNTAPPANTTLLFRADGEVNINAPILNNTTTGGNIIEFDSRLATNINSNITNNGVGNGQIRFRSGVVTPLSVAPLTVALGVTVTNTSAGEILLSSFADDVVVNGNLSCSGTGGMTLRAGVTGDVEINSTATTNFTNGGFRCETDPATNLGSVFLEGSYSFTGSSSMTITAGGDVSATPSAFTFNTTGSANIQSVGPGLGSQVLLNNGSLGANVYELFNGPFTLSATNAVQFEGPLTKTSTQPLTLTSATESAGLLRGTININAGDVNITAFTAAGLGISTGTVNVNTTGQVNVVSNGPAATSSAAMQGPINYNTGDVNFTANGTINVSNTVNYNGGTLDLIAGNDIVIGPGTLTVASVNPFNATTTGVLVPSDFILTATIVGTGGPINLNINGSATFNGAVNLNTAQPFTVSCTTGNINVNRIITNISSGQIIASCPGNFSVGTLTGTLPSQIGSANGNTVLGVGGNLNVFAGSGAGATSTLGLATGNSSLLATVAGDVAVEGNGNNIAAITSSGPLIMDIGGDFLMTSDQILGGTGEARIIGESDITINSTNMGLTGFTGGPQVLIETTGGNIQLVAQNNFILDSNGQVVNQGSGEIAIVVDQQAPSPPGFGTGIFNLDANTQIGRVGGGAVRIFTAIPPANVIDGLINGMALVTVGGPPSNLEQYNVYFSSFGGGFGIPFTIFYKSTGIPNLGPPGTDVIFTLAELDRILYRYEGFLFGFRDNFSFPFYLCGAIEDTGIVTIRQRLFHPQHFLNPYFQEFDCNCIKYPEKCEAIFPR
ncbi:MAG: hypothetical protein L0207_04110, partial [Chlamydiae bacterium]|nr:hypothetical protein [Chlamydiota bacterium]